MWYQCNTVVISIHALLAESDFGDRAVHQVNEQFLSTLSLRRATVKAPCMQVIFDISIHALLAESDGTSALRTGRCLYFYPRSPCGERQQGTRLTVADVYISIHALLAESDVRPRSCGRGPLYFYPRSPCGERHTWPLVIGPLIFISIHALLAESDCLAR